jgi:hypothetical protein
MCIIVNKKVGNTTIMAKNRDRAYKPVLEVVHTIIDGVEVAYLHDVTTDWSEGMNEFGIGILNTALMVGYDEAEKKIVKKRGKPSKDGQKIRKALAQKTIKDTINYATKYLGGVRGHTFISTPTKMVSIETTSKHTPKFEIHPLEKVVVRTNHGHIHYNAGYTKGPDYLSSKIRKISAEKAINKATNKDEVLPLLRKQFYKNDSNLNMKRNTKKMFTSSQTLLDLTNKTFTLNYLKDKVEEFKGIKTILPKGYQPKIKVIALGV